MSDEKTRNRIMEAAGPVFAAKGFRGATVREICEAAQVNVASINYHFGDKGRLYVDTVRMARHLRAQQFPFPEWAAPASPKMQLEGFVATLLQRMTSDDESAWHVRLLTREIMQPTEACGELVQQYFKPIYEQLLTIVDSIVETKLPESRRHQIGFSIIGQCLFYRFAGRLPELFVSDEARVEQFETAALAKHISSFCYAALQKIKEGDGDIVDLPPSISVD